MKKPNSRSELGFLLIHFLKPKKQNAKKVNKIYVFCMGIKYSVADSLTLLRAKAIPTLRK